MSSDSVARLESQWRGLTRELRHVGKKFKIGALLNACKEREITDDTIVFKFSHRSHMERMLEELDNPESSREFQDILFKAMDKTYQVKLSVVETDRGGRPGDQSRTSHLVRAAQTMGARVIDEKEIERTP